MASFRAFVAIELPDDVKESLKEILTALSRQDRQGAVRWTRAEGIHLTLKFLGDTDEIRLSAIERALRDVTERHQPLSLRLGELGIFAERSGGQPRVICVGLEGDLDILAALQRDVDTALVETGFEAETRAFTPHLTLGRISRGRESLKDWSGVATVHRRGPDFRVDGISLMESDLTRGGARYRRRLFIPLRGARA